MEFRRIRSPQELIVNRDEILELFKKSIERTKTDIDPERMFLNHLKNLAYTDYLLFLFKEPKGFMSCKLFNNSTFKVLFVDYLYCPRGGFILWGIIKNIALVIGADEIWGNTTEKVYRIFRKVIGKAEKQFIVRLIP